jgi:hypothetical protein
LGAGLGRGAHTQQELPRALAQGDGALERRGVAGGQQRLILGELVIIRIGVEASPALLKEPARSRTSHEICAMSPLVGAGAD